MHTSIFRHRCPDANVASVRPVLNSFCAALRVDFLALDLTFGSDACSSSSRLAHVPSHIDHSDTPGWIPKDAKHQ